MTHAEIYAKCKHRKEGLTGRKWWIWDFCVLTVIYNQSQQAACQYKNKATGPLLVARRFSVLTPRSALLQGVPASGVGLPDKAGRLISIDIQLSTSLSSVVLCTWAAGQPSSVNISRPSFHRTEAILSCRAGVMACEAPICRIPSDNSCRNRHVQEVSKVHRLTRIYSAAPLSDELFFYPSPGLFNLQS